MVISCILYLQPTNFDHILYLVKLNFDVVFNPGKVHLLGQCTLLFILEA